MAVKGQLVHMCETSEVEKPKERDKEEKKLNREKRDKCKKNG